MELQIPANWLNGTILYLVEDSSTIFFYLKLAHGTKWVTGLCYKIFVSHRGYGVRQDKRYTVSWNELM